MNRAYLASARTLAFLQVLIGTAMVVSSLARGGGPLALGVVLGVMITALGAGRLLLARSRER